MYALWHLGRRFEPPEHYSWAQPLSLLDSLLHRCLWQGNSWSSLITGRALRSALTHVTLQCLNNSPQYNSITIWSPVLLLMAT